MTSQKLVEGSILKKIVATELQIERDNCNFDQKELALIFHDQETQDA
jgi:hypothetical protein